MPKSIRSSRRKSTRLELSRARAARAPPEPLKSGEFRIEITKARKEAEEKLCQYLRGNRVRCDLDVEHPMDSGALRERLDRKRDSASPDIDAYEAYKHSVACSDNEPTMISNTWNGLAKRLSYINDGLNYLPLHCAEWTNVRAQITAETILPKPDYSESLMADQYPKRARDYLGGYLSPTGKIMGMPTFCVEFCDPYDRMSLEHYQTAHDGALMTEAAIEMQRYAGKTPIDLYGITQAITIETNGTVLELRGCYALEREGRLEFHHYPLDYYLSVKSYDGFKRAYRHVRNAQDWAKERAVATLNELWAYDKTFDEPASSGKPAF